MTQDNDNDEPVYDLENADEVVESIKENGMQALEPGETVLDEVFEPSKELMNSGLVVPVERVENDAISPFEFSCSKRVYDPSMDAYCYHVEPCSGGYDTLDFTGHIVLINGRERLCDKFLIENGKIIIVVNEMA